MRKPTPLMRLVRQRRDLTVDLMPLCDPSSHDLATLSASQVERLRADVDTLGALIGAWQVLHHLPCSHDERNRGAK